MNRSKEWIRIPRSIMDKKFYTEKPFGKCGAFIDLVLLADDGEQKRGCVYKSQLSLAQRWGWSRQKTRLFLNNLRDNGLIEYHSTGNGTVITIKNYSVFLDE